MKVINLFQMQSRMLIFLTLGLSVFGAQTLDAQFVSKRCIEVNNTSTNTGTVTFTFIPEGGIAQEIPVTIVAGLNGAQAATKIKEALRDSLSTDDYRIFKNAIGGKIVYVIRKRNKAKFTLTKSGQTVNGTTVEVTTPDSQASFVPSSGFCGEAFVAVPLTTDPNFSLIANEVNAVSLGTGVTVTNLVILDDNNALVDFSIAPNPPLGFEDILLLNITASDTLISGFAVEFDVNCAIQSVPTLSEWGLIILALLGLSIGMVFIRRRESALALAGANQIKNKASIFNKQLYLKTLAIILLIAAVGISLSIFWFGYVTVTDFVGTLISSSIIAYIVQLWILQKKD